MKFFIFHKMKDDFVEPMCEQFRKWEPVGLSVKFVWCENAGENKSVEKAANRRLRKLNIIFEYTARHTPQQNHLVELGLTILANRARAMLN